MTDISICVICTSRVEIIHPRAVMQLVLLHASTVGHSRNLHTQSLQSGKNEHSAFSKN